MDLQSLREPRGAIEWFGGYVVKKEVRSRLCRDVAGEILGRYFVNVHSMGKRAWGRVGLDRCVF